MVRSLTLTLGLLALTLAGCGSTDGPAGSVPLADGSLHTLTFNASDYRAASFADVGGFWSAEGAGAHNGQRFYAVGQLVARPVAEDGATWDASLAAGDESVRVLWDKRFVTRGEAERWLLRMGAGTASAVTVYFTVRDAAQPSERIRLDGVKRPNGALIRL